jgi:hypothetical protein
MKPAVFKGIGWTQETFVESDSARTLLRGLAKANAQLLCEKSRLLEVREVVAGL